MAEDVAFGEYWKVDSNERFGASATLNELTEMLEEFRLDGVVQRMCCPFLLTHGEEDTQIPLTDARALYEAVGSKDKTFKVFTAAEGGAQHCQRDNMSLGVTYMADWLSEQLRA